MISERNSFRKRVWAALGSRRLFWWICMLISGVIIIGLIFNKGGVYPGVSNSLDGEILIRWLTGLGGHSYPVVRAWLIVLIVLLFILGINLTMCALSDMAQLWRLFWEWRKRNVSGNGVRTANKLAVLLMHASYIILLLTHVIPATTGFKISGIELRPGQIISHEKLPYSLCCEKIVMSKKDPRGGPSRPSVVLRPMVPDSEPFIIPKPPWGSGWHDGYFYRIYAEYTKPKPGEIVERRDWRKRKLIALKLGISRVYYTFPLVLGGILFMSGAALHMVLRRRNSGR